MQIEQMEMSSKIISLWNVKKDLRQLVIIDATEMKMNLMELRRRKRAEQKIDAIGHKHERKETKI